MISDTARYFARFGFYERQIRVPAQPGLSLVVVIPCFNEPDLVASLESLRQSERPAAPVEVIVVVNSPAGAADSILDQNERTIALAQSWIAAQPDPKLTVHIIHAMDLPARHAGVGLARKIGMDEALRRFDDVEAVDWGVIACFDADCKCAPNYLQAVADHFARHGVSPGCSIYFEHSLSGDLPAGAYEAIIPYELHLRYYVQALRYAGFPHAFHTIGSSMAVRARAYRAQGGMNRRQAGEDFYFLHKIIPLGGFTELNTTAVYPSPRPSDRVPFGTGRAVSESLLGQPFSSYPLEAFDDLRVFLERVRQCSPHEMTTHLPRSIQTFLARHNFDVVVEGIRRNTTTPEMFTKRFFRWFDGFRAMKFIHHARDSYYGSPPVDETARALLSRLGLPGNPLPHAARELLRRYRELDRGLPLGPKLLC